MNRRVVITGVDAVTALGNNWQEIRCALLKKENAVRYMQSWSSSRACAPNLRRW